MPERVRPVLFDTVTLSNFALAGRFDLLIARYGRRAHITQSVLDEIAHGVVSGFLALGAIEDTLANAHFTAAAPLAPAARAIFRELLHNLGPGEASCIAAAQACAGIVATDDRVARICCAERALPVTGTIGILRACVGDGTLAIADADRTLDAMIRAGYRAPIQRISDLA